MQAPTICTVITSGYAYLHQLLYITLVLKCIPSNWKISTSKVETKRNY